MVSVSALVMPMGLERLDPEAVAAGIDVGNDLQRTLGPARAYDAGPLLLVPTSRKLWQFQVRQVVVAGIIEHGRA